MPDPSPRWRLIWGDAVALLHRTRQFTWVDLLVLVFLAAAVWGMVDLAKGWKAPHRVSSEINLSPLVLPDYTFYSLSRGLAAYAISLASTLFSGSRTANDHTQ